MIKGDKIKLKAPMGVFTNVGEICEVVDITEGGMISFRFGGWHLGCMSYDECGKYFELCKKPNRKWSEWKTHGVVIGDDDGIDIQYRTNGKEIQVRGDGIKASASCMDTDDFSFHTGYELALRRWRLKYCERELRKYEDRLK